MALGPVAKTWLNRAGTFLGLAGILFVGVRLHGYAGEIDFRRIGAGGYAAMAALALVYGASNLLLTAGWRCLMHYLGVPISRGWAVQTYATSQLAKYVPGNIFQFAGRQAIGVAAGIGNAPLAKSTGFELAFLIVGGALFSPLILSLLVSEIPDWVGWIFFAFTVLLALWLANRIGGRDFGAAAVFYFAFLAISGLVFVGVYGLAGGTGGVALYPAIAGAYVLAWLAGLITPGAPAGLGVREAVLLFLLGSSSAGPTILLAVVIGRAITVLGDLLFFCSGIVARNFWRVSSEQ